MPAACCHFTVCPNTSSATALTFFVSLSKAACCVWRLCEPARLCDGPWLGWHLGELSQAWLLCSRFPQPDWRCASLAEALWSTAVTRGLLPYAGPIPPQCAYQPLAPWPAWWPVALPCARLRDCFIPYAAAALVSLWSLLLVTEDWSNEFSEVVFTWVCSVGWLGTQRCWPMRGTQEKGSHVDAQDSPQQCLDSWLLTNLKGPSAAGPCLPGLSKPPGNGTGVCDSSPSPILPKLGPRGSSWPCTCGISVPAMCLAGW